MGFVDEFEAMVEAGAGLVVATVCPDGTPRATRAWSFRPVGGDTNRVRVAVTGDDSVTVDNLASGVLALTVAHVRTLRSLQMTGRAVVVEPPADDDVADARRQTDIFFASVSEIDGIALELLQRIFPRRLTMVELQVDARYDQTPGPTAGALIDGEDA